MVIESPIDILPYKTTLTNPYISPLCNPLHPSVNKYSVITSCLVAAVSRIPVSAFDRYRVACHLGYWAQTLGLSQIKDS